MDQISRDDVRGMQQINISKNKVLQKFSRDKNLLECEFECRAGGLEF